MAVQQGDRVAALAELARIEHVLSQMGSWLDDLGHERAAVLIEDAWRDVLAAQALIDRDPARVTPSFSPCKHPVPAAPPRYVRLA